MFRYEQFEAYQLSIEYWETALQLLIKIPPGNSVIKDQLKRVTSSISLNIVHYRQRFGDGMCRDLRSDSTG